MDVAVVFQGPERIPDGGLGQAQRLVQVAQGGLDRRGRPGVEAHAGIQKLLEDQRSVGGAHQRVQGHTEQTNAAHLPGFSGKRLGEISGVVLVRPAHDSLHGDGLVSHLLEALDELVRTHAPLQPGAGWGGVVCGAIASRQVPGLLESFEVSSDRVLATLLSRAVGQLTHRDGHPGRLGRGRQIREIMEQRGAQTGALDQLGDLEAQRHQRAPGVRVGRPDQRAVAGGGFLGKAWGKSGSGHGTGLREKGPMRPSRRRHFLDRGSACGYITQAPPGRGAVRARTGCLSNSRNSNQVGKTKHEFVRFRQCRSHGKPRTL